MIEIQIIPCDRCQGWMWWLSQNQGNFEFLVGLLAFQLIISMACSEYPVLCLHAISISLIYTYALFMYGDDMMTKTRDVVFKKRDMTSVDDNVAQSSTTIIATAMAMPRVNATFREEYRNYFICIFYYWWISNYAAYVNEITIGPVFAMVLVGFRTLFVLICMAVYFVETFFSKTIWTYSTLPMTSVSMHHGENSQASLKIFTRSTHAGALRIVFIIYLMTTTFMDRLWNPFFSDTMMGILPMSWDEPDPCCCCCCCY